MWKHSTRKLVLTKAKVATLNSVLTFDNEFCRDLGLARRVGGFAGEGSRVLFVSGSDQQQSVVPFVDHLQQKHAHAKLLIDCLNYQL